MGTKAQQRYTACRPQDYAYDPLFVVSNQKDHLKAALIAKLSTAKFQICPIFANMFSDLPTHPRKQYIRRRSAPIISSRTNYKSKLENCIQYPLQKTVDVVGVDRFKYFHLPKTNVGCNFIPNLPLFIPSASKDKPTEPLEKIKNKKNQNKFRENSAQTSPWQPAFIVTDNTEPELLKLDFLKWGSGLPAGMHEVQLIERARMKRAWEAKFDIKNEEDLHKRRNVIAAMERDEWAFREKEIEDIQNLRLELLERMLNELHETSNHRSEQKIKQFSAIKQKEKEEKLRKLREKTKREIRKLNMKESGHRNKYGFVNITEEHANHASELYAPLMRHGEHPKRWHQVIDEAIGRFKAQFVGVEDFITLPAWLNKATKIKDSTDLKLPGTRLCIKETKWTTPVLKQLHEELLAFRKHNKQPCTLLERIETPSSVPSTPEVEGISDADEDFYQAMVYLQSVIKGRAAQMHIYEGRERCRELIQELKYSTGLLDEENARIYDYKLKIKLQQRQEQIETEKIYKLQERLDKLQGTVVGSLLDFLNKELRRLLEERRAHAICIILERERYDREASEAGRRQVELRRRREHDEMFKNVVKIQQETVDMYLENIIREGMEFASEEEAHEYIKRLAGKIDEEAFKLHETLNSNVDEEEEMVANLVHHFILPEAQKELVRDKMQKKQKEKLRAVHDAINSLIEDVPPNQTEEK